MQLLPPPTLPPLIVLKAKPGCFYVYTYKNEWDREKKRSKRVGSKKVGKIIGEEKEGVVEFDADFIAQYPGLKDFVTTKVGRKFEFTPIEKEEHIPHESTQPVEIKHAGATWALDNIVAKTPLAQALQQSFPKYNDYLKILSLAYYIVMNPSNSVYRYEEFSESTLLPYNEPMDSSVITRLFQRITPEQVDTFITTINQLYFQKYASCDASNALYFAFDSTSVSTYSDNLSLAQYGHNNDVEKLKQMNALMLVDQQHGIPLFYRSYNGEVPNVVTIRNTLAQRTNLTLNKNIVFVSDTGSHSSATINDCLAHDFGFIFNCAVKQGSFIQEEVDALKSELRSCANFMGSSLGNCVSKETTWCYDASPADKKNNSLKKTAQLKLHIFYNKNIFDSEYECLVNTAYTAISKLKKVNGDPSKIYPIDEQILQKYTDFKYDAKSNTYRDCRISPVKIEEKLKYSGIRVLITNQLDFSPEQCLFAYYERNKVEYAFNTLSYRLGSNSFYCSDDSSFNGESFVQFIATAISLQVRLQLSKHKNTVKDEKLKSHIVYDSDNKILSSLHNIFIRICNDGLIFDEIVGKKADYYRALGVPLPTKGCFDVYNNQFRDEIPEPRKNVSEVLVGLDLEDDLR